MEKISVKVFETVVLEYNAELFKENMEEILFRVLREIGAPIASEHEIMLANYSDLKKLNDLMMSYLTE